MSGFRLAACRPHISSSWLVESTTLCTPSVSIAEDPVIAAATNFDTAMPRLARRATTSVRVLAVGLLIGPRSDVDHAPKRGEHAFVHHLRKRRVREDRLDEVGLDQLGGLADGVALD